MGDAMKPVPEELPKLRKGLRKRKLPHVVNGMWSSEPGIGGFKFDADGEDFNVTWVTFTDGVKSALKFASFNQLCNDSGHEFKRLEVGYLIAEFCDRDAQNVMDSIGHPIEAWNAADPQRKEADSWRHWALVPAGHFIRK
jgi:hypothetical protein